MFNWIILTFLYAMFNGLFECSKKKAVEKSSIYEVLAYFSLISFGMVAFFSKNVFSIQLQDFLFILLKVIVVIIAWILSLYAIDKMSISLYGTIKVFRVIFSVLLSIVLLGEQLDIITIVGTVIVIIGLYLMNNVTNEKSKEKTNIKAIILLIVACLLNAISAIIDKKILLNVTSSQLQFWFLLFLSIGYWIIVLIKNKKVNIKGIAKNYWILIVAITLVIGDRFLFMANEMPESKVATMSIIKQLSTIEIIILGKIMFNEKNIIKKLLCSTLVIFGTILILIQ